MPCRRDDSSTVTSLKTGSSGSRELTPRADKENSGCRECLDGSDDPKFECSATNDRNPIHAAPRKGSEDPRCARPQTNKLDSGLPQPCEGEKNPGWITSNAGSDRPNHAALCREGNLSLLHKAQIAQGRGNLHPATTGLSQERQS